MAFTRKRWWAEQATDQDCQGQSEFELVHDANAINGLP